MFVSFFRFCYLYSTVKHFAMTLYCRSLTDDLFLFPSIRFIALRTSYKNRAWIQNGLYLFIVYCTQYVLLFVLWTSYVHQSSSCYINLQDLSHIFSIIVCGKIQHNDIVILVSLHCLFHEETITLSYDVILWSSNRILPSIPFLNSSFFSSLIQTKWRYLIET